MTGKRAPAALERRHALLTAALPLLARAGYHGVSVPELAKAAGMATGSVYKHFESKAHLVNVLLRDHYAALHGQLARASAAGTLRSVFEAAMAFAREQREAFDFLFLFEHGEYADMETLALRRQLDAVVREVITTQWQLKHGAAAPTGPLTVAVTLFWATCTFVVRELRRGALGEGAQPTEVAAWLLENGILNPPTPDRQV